MKELNKRTYLKIILKNKIINSVILIAFALIITSCTSSYNMTNKKAYGIQVDSYGNQNSASGQKYFLFPSDTTINENDLQYIEFADYVKKALSSKGYSEALSLQDADLFIFFKYGISDPETFQRNVAIPVWGQTGISSTSTTGNVYVNPYSNTINYNQNTTSTPTYGITGTTNYTQSITRYLRYLTITVYDYKVYEKTKKEKVVWNTIITSTGTGGDLRKAFPYLLVAGKDYFGQSSGERKELLIYVGDERVQQLKEMSIE